MRYIDYLKIYIKLAGWIYSATIMGYYVACYLRSIQPTPISIGTIAQAVWYILFGSLGQWWIDSSKK